ncbi:MAG TPA: hypothetical protein VHT02_08210 [Methylocella sp.]|nr:hypothetical protein [Methylocella sp.]
MARERRSRFGAAAQKLGEGDEAGAQKGLDASGLTRLSSDGAVLMRAIAGSLGIGPLDPHWTDGPRLWRAEDIEAHLPLFKDHAGAAVLNAACRAVNCSQSLWKTTARLPRHFHQASPGHAG